MREMGLQVIYSQPCTSRLGTGHQINPYFLRVRVIDRPDQIWTTDITYIPLACKFMYLVAIMDWRSRPVLA